MTREATHVNGSSSEAAPRLRRVLSLWDLIFYGIVSVTPSAPITVFGLALVLSRGFAIDTILIAMVAIVLTATSYGRMAAVYPSAGSAYTYVGRGLNPHLGFLTGWTMLFEYLAIPIFCVLFGTLSIRRVFPHVPYVVWAAALAGAITYLNLRGIRSTARANQVLLAFMGAVLLAFIALAIRYLVFHKGWSGLISGTPFYVPKTFDLTSIATATSFAALTYLGFDSVTTLAEDVHNPRRNVLLATVSVCVFTGLFGGLLVYLGQLVWPQYHTFTDAATAFLDVAGRAGGTLMFQAMAILLVVANIGAALTAQVGVARLLFGMGRDGVLPKRFFAYLDPKKNTPTLNIWLIGVIAFVGSLVMHFELAADIQNFGAFLVFMGVNLAAIRQFYFTKQRKSERNLLRDVVVPALGFLFCLGIWWGLPKPAKIAGGIWFAGGFIYDALRSRGFRFTPPMIDFGESGAEAQQP